MILPNKVISVEKSLLFIGGNILKFLDNPQTISNLWEITKSRLNINSFQFFMLTLDLLYTVNAIDFKDNKIHKRSK